MFKKLLAQMRNRTELIVLVIMIMVVVMLIIPLPTYVVDFLIGLNLIMALLIFIGSFYITRILEFSTFPSILLVSTIFRLAISISTSRLVLADADAGEIIASFGNFVIADNLVVGFVIFFIVTIVQFIVITKGSERIAEVAARFSLDAMPGKQMSIDADLKAGVIDGNEVKRRRSDLEAESQLYGALDGAMKFIKGDAIAGIIIIFVNLIGGISVGTLQHGMDISHALTVYTQLTIGDALVAQIPALLISISGGLIVTRVNNSKNNNLGANIIQDMFSNKFILVLTAILSIAMGMLPGFPLIVFFLLSAVLMSCCIKSKLSESHTGKKNQSEGVERDISDKASQPVMIDGEYIPETIPLILTAWKGNESYYIESNFVSLIKRNFFIEYGVRLPDILMNYEDGAERSKLTVAINEIQVASYDFLPGMRKVMLRGDELQMVDDSVIAVPDVQGNTYWLPEGRSESAHNLGYHTRSAIDEFYACLSTLLARNISEFFGIQESKVLLDDLESKYPELLKECYRNNTVQRITEVFHRLLQERISIRNMRLILEALVQWSPKEKDPIMLVEHVRGVLSRYISNRFSVNGRIRALVITSDVESMLRSGIRQTSSGTFINLSPHETESVLNGVSGCIADAGINARDIIVVVPSDIRRFIKKIIESHFPEMDVLSFSDISSGVDIDVVGTLEIT
jgi:type III secretion protein V